MARQEVARAALQSLHSHAEEEESQHTLQALQPQQYSRQSSSASPSNLLADSSVSYFGGSALQITDSPSTSPNLAAQQFDTSRKFFKRSRGDDSFGTAGTSDVPSLSLSNSTFSDGPLRSPFAEHVPSTASISSTHTAHPPHTMLEDEKRQEAGMNDASVRRVASNMQLSVDDVQRVKRCMSRQNEDSAERAKADLMEELGRDRFHAVVDAVLAEEERLSQINSFRLAYLRAESLRSDMDFEQQRYRSGSSRSIPLSPPPNYEPFDLMDPSAPIPSPRAALESLTISSGNDKYSYQQQQHSIYPTLHSPTSSTFDPQHWSGSNAYSTSRNTASRVHSRQTSGGSRPISLPDRSYRSMDDYTAQAPFPVASPLLRNGVNMSVRRSIHETMSSPSKRSSNSRQASRSPLIESPRLIEDDGMEVEEDDSLANSPHVSKSQQHLRPESFSIRHRSASSNEYDGFNILTKASRRASAEVLGHSINRTSSPLAMTMEDASEGLSLAPSSQPLSHEEVMARLQRKVKERLAARNALQDFDSSNIIVGGRARTRTATSPTLNKHASLPYGSPPSSYGSKGGRRLQAALANQSLSTNGQRSTSSTNRKPRKSASLKAISREAEQQQQQRRSSYRERDVELDNGLVSPSIADDAKMEDIFVPSDIGSAGTGIEALLSAAAIADSPRIGFL
jgi:hypothetical protein